MPFISQSALDALTTTLARTQDQVNALVRTIADLKKDGFSERTHYPDYLPAKTVDEEDEAAMMEND